MYKWKDKSGVVHYTETPPPDSSYQSKKLSPAPQPSVSDQMSAMERLQRNQQSLAALRQRMDILKAQNAQQASKQAISMSQVTAQLRSSICPGVIRNLNKSLAEIKEYPGKFTELLIFH